MKIAIQGIEGSFHHAAANKMFESHQIEFIYAVNFKQVFDEVLNGSADYGVTAIENNLYGSINEVYGLLERHSVWISADYRMRIGQCLIGGRPSSLSELAKAGSFIRILSQLPALAQVELWLDENLPSAVREETHDTAASVKYVMEQSDPNILAIAGEAAANTYGGYVIAKDINDDPDNYTRFIAFSKQRAVTEEANASSYILKTDHSPGALVKALSILADHELNLSKLDSHPIPGDKQHYAFYVDIDAAYEDPIAAKALEEIKALGYQMTLLGSYRHVK